MPWAAHSADEAEQESFERSVFGRYDLRWPTTNRNNSGYSRLNCWSFQYGGHWGAHHFASPKPEQDQIVESVREQTAGLVTAISRLNSEIDLLREYSTRLIADVVTGKLDVRQAAAQLPDEPLDTAKVEDVEAEASDEVEDEEGIAD